jgi:2-polyprenyl-6-methoxyphenol hydroxylase-like FAD-dependent oxidoreductase
MDVDVLIVGAGPTGLMLANQLGRRGIRPLIIDRHSGPAQQSRALGVHARTMEIYSKLGVVERALSLGKAGTGANMWAQGRHMARIPLGEAGKAVTPYPYVFILGQDDNEVILGERLRDWGVDIQWNTELVGLEQHQDHVVATLRQPDQSSRTVTAAWVAGCDGARSAVRELNGITFPGAPYEHVFFVADTVATGTMVADEVNVYLLKSGFHLFFPMRGKDHWRVVGILPPELRNQADLAFEAVVPFLRTEAGSNLEFQACSWFSTYRIHHRAASRFRKGRCFLLGDAAHIHSPVGAQGMNTGLQDAYNLAWKLALVLRKEAGEPLLDTYEEERIPIAQRLLNTTDRAFRLVVADNPLADLFRTQVIARVAAAAMETTAIQARAFRTVSQTGIHYAWSSLSRSTDRLPEGGPRAGDRFPWLHLRFSPGAPVEDAFQKLDDTKFNLVVVGQPAPAPVLSGELLAIHEIPPDPANDKELARAHIPGVSFYLVRPDGHVGLCGRRLDAGVLEGYFARRLHRTESPTLDAGNGDRP